MIELQQNKAKINHINILWNILYLLWFVLTLFFQCVFKSSYSKRVRVLWDILNMLWYTYDVFSANYSLRGVGIYCLCYFIFTVSLRFITWWERPINIRASDIAFGLVRHTSNTNLNLALRLHQNFNMCLNKKQLNSRYSFHQHPWHLKNNIYSR